MGLDYSYLLYFNRYQLKEVLLGVADIAIKHEPPTQIQFPDSVIEVPLESFSSTGKDVHYNDPELGFSTVLIFDEDDAMMDWGHAQAVENPDRSPPGKAHGNRVSVGYIYLTVYNELPAYDFPGKNLNDLILFDFGTTGTRMSTLFYYSTSIRKTFVELLEKHNGVCGVFNKEEEGEVFWLKGKKLTKFIDDPWLFPDEIEAIMRTGNQKGVNGQ